MKWRYWETKFRKHFFPNHMVLCALVVFNWLLAGFILLLRFKGQRWRAQCCPGQGVEQPSLAVSRQGKAATLTLW